QPLVHWQPPSAAQEARARRSKRVVDRLKRRPALSPAQVAAAGFPRQYWVRRFLAAVAEREPQWAHSRQPAARTQQFPARQSGRRLVLPRRERVDAGSSSRAKPKST